MPHSKSYLGFIGTRGDLSHDIFAFEVDCDSGQLSHLATSEVGPNPAFLAAHPSSEYLYAVNQVPDGSITALAVDHETGELEVVTRRKTGDAHPCYVSGEPTGSFAMVARHTGGAYRYFR